MPEAEELVPEVAAQRDHDHSDDLRRQRRHAEQFDEEWRAEEARNQPTGPHGKEPPEIAEYTSVGPEHEHPVRRERARYRHDLGGADRQHVRQTGLQTGSDQGEITRGSGTRDGQVPTLFGPQQPAKPPGKRAGEPVDHISRVYGHGR